MSEMYERIEKLCKDNGMSVSKMCRELSITRSCLSELSTGRTERLSTVNAGKIADYFGVSVQYLTNGAEKKLDDELKFALFNGSDGVTDEMVAEVRQFAERVKLREDAKRRHGG